jgi:hypothetical protein
MNNFITGAVAALAAMVISLVLCGVVDRDSHTLNVLNICQKSLPRDQKCIIVAICPGKDIPAKKADPNKSTEHKALNEIKGEVK